MNKIYSNDLTELKIDVLIQMLLLIHKENMYLMYENTGLFKPSGRKIVREQVEKFEDMLKDILSEFGQCD